jgi:hypothetical protein
MEKSNISKIKLYCALHGNNALVMCNDTTKENNCVKCRAKNEGICNIRYEGNNRQILYNVKTGKILTMSDGGFLEKEWIGKRTFILGGKTYHSSDWDWCWFCFGFLGNENGDRKTRKKV